MLKVSSETQPSIWLLFGLVITEFSAVIFLVVGRLIFGARAIRTFFGLNPDTDTHAEEITGRPPEKPNGLFPSFGRVIGVQTEDKGSGPVPCATSRYFDVRPVSNLGSLDPSNWEFASLEDPGESTHSAEYHMPEGGKIGMWSTSYLTQPQYHLETPLGFSYPSESITWERPSITSLAETPSTVGAEWSPDSSPMEPLHHYSVSSGLAPHSASSLLTLGLQEHQQNSQHSMPMTQHMAPLLEESGTSQLFADPQNLTFTPSIEAEIEAAAAVLDRPADPEPDVMFPSPPTYRSVSIPANTEVVSRVSKRRHPTTRRSKMGTAPLLPPSPPESAIPVAGNVRTRAMHGHSNQSVSPMATASQTSRELTPESLYGTSSGSNTAKIYEHRCPHCHASFRIKGYLTRHIKKHADQKAYTCPFYHPDGPNKCHVTGGFSRRDTYKTHLKTRHFVYPTGTACKVRGLVAGQCSGCGLKFANNELWIEEHIVTGACEALKKRSSHLATSPVDHEPRIV